LGKASKEISPPMENVRPRWANSFWRAEIIVLRTFAVCAGVSGWDREEWRKRLEVVSKR
jgi:hypothetical protein